MKKNLVLTAIAILVLMTYACGGGKYGAVKTVLEKQVTMTESFSAAMDKAGNADDVAAAITAYAEGMKVLAPQMKELGEKFPEIKNQSEPPEELKPLVKKMEEMAQKMMAGMSKMAQYAMDPKVQAAQAKLMESMQAMK